jgi:hypothetical protein
LYGIFDIIPYVLLSFVLEQWQPTGLRHYLMKNCKHCLKIATALKHTKTTQTFNLFKKNHIHIHYVGTSIQSWLALNAKDRGFSPSHIKIDFIIKIGIGWFSNKLTA